ncbi:MAG: hypothetical protein CMJ52_08725, partial [Planctomycetaceae bacterium]|nr:hypothetical protein [Planctomycetaceae bacterium]
FSESLSALTDPKDALRVMSRIALIFLGVGAVLQVAATIQYVCFSKVAKTLSHRMRMAWYRALVRQDMAWFDQNDPSGLAAKMASSMMTYEQGMGGQLSLGVQFLSGFIGSVIIAFVFNAYISLITVATMPLCALSMAYLLKLNDQAAESKDEAYAKANSLAHEAFVGLKTVLSLNAGRRLEDKYSAATDVARKAGITRSVKVGFANGSMLSTFNVMYLAITLFGGWALAKQIRDDGCDPSGQMVPRFSCGGFKLNNEMDGTGIFVALICISQGAQALGAVSRAFDQFSQARKAIKAAVDIVKRRPEINWEDESKGLKPDGGMRGHIRLEGVRFSYPSRPEMKVCENLSLDLPPGTTVALAGESGCGKSTITQLLQRFYDPNEGRVTVDGHDLKDLNVRWLRQHIAVVAQEPKLFSGTIGENIALGAVSAGKTESVSQEEIVQAAKMANAHGFITEFQSGYDTEVGFGGSQLSGGQKQRIAIARALIKRPRILLLDEATSALDNKSEKVVQEALDEIIREGGKENSRTTVVIAHRLSTIRTADVICYVKEGQIVEKGSHEELMRIKEGHYRNLVEKQQIAHSEESNGSGGTVSKSNSLVDLKQQAKGKAQREDLGVKKDQEKQKDVEEGSSKEQKQKDEEIEEYKVPWSRIFAISKPDTKYLCLGVLTGMFAGALYPFWGYMFAKMIVVFFTPVAACVDTPAVSGTESNFPSPLMLGFPTCDAYFQSQADKLWKESVYIAYYWIGIALACLAVNTCMFYGFGAASENLSFRVRNRMFASYLRQEPGYFDLPENAVGAVSSRLANDATLLKAKTGEPLQQVVMTLFGCVAGIVLSAVFCWPVALMAVGILPILGVAITLQTQIILGSGGKDSTAEDPAIGALAGETLTAMRTVATGLEPTFVQKYEDLLGGSMSTKELLRKALGFGISFSVQHWAFALLMWFGAWVLDNMTFSFEDFSVALFAFFFGLFGMSLAATGATDTKEAVRALTSIFSLLDRQSKIDPEGREGIIPVEEAKGQIDFEDVKFKYPARPDQVVCQNLSFSVESGQKIGVVGSSGSGKSTIIQLIERFYDPVEGQTLFDKTANPSINYHWLHDQMGLVSQEPILFSGSVFENIALGAPTGKEATMDDVMEAAKMANAHNFVMEFQDQYDTDIGPGGTLLSGGQKQRIAIARALLSKPKVLLLDEATSALDAKSEAVVQATLDTLMAQSNLTTLMIAHRLSTVRHMNKIMVIESGKVIEMGDHQELMSLEGVYYGLVQASGYNAT